MNKIYKTVWSAKKGTYVAVSEIVTNRGKEAGGSEEASTSKPSGRLKTLARILLSIGFVSGFATQAVAQDVTPGNIGSVLGTTYDSDTKLFVIPSNGIGGTGKDTVFEAIGEVQGGLTSLSSSVGNGLNVRANAETSDKLGLGETLTLANGTNTTVSYNADTNTFKTNLNPNISLTSVTTSGAVAANSLSVTNNATVGGKLNVTGLSTLSGGANLGGKTITDLADGSIASNSSDAVTGGQIHNILFGDDAKGIKYFRVNSEKDDAEATGVDSIAIGPKATAAGDNSVAIGDEASTIGGAKSKGSIALGNKATIFVDVNDDDSDATGAIAIGQEATSSAASAIALGQIATASGASSVAIGNTAKASGADSVALGNGAQAMARENISIGHLAGVGTVNETANDQFQNIAIGSQAGQDVLGYGNVALGYHAGSDVSGNNNIAFGSNAGDGLTNDDNISIGRDSNEPGNGWRVIAIGAESNAKETASVALGYKSSAHGTLTLALGAGSVATEGGSVALGTFSSAESGHIAIGQYSSVTAADASGVGAFGGHSADGAVSVGTAAREVTDPVTGSTHQADAIKRRIVNVADGKEDSDAATVAQLKEVAAGFPNIDYEGLAERVTTNLGSTFDAIQHHYVSINDGGTEKSNYNNTGAKQLDSIAIGPTASANAEKATVLGSDLTAFSTAQNSVVVGTSISAEGKNSVTIGNTNTLTEDESGIAIGTSVTSRGENSIVIGRGSEVDYQGVVGETIENSIVIGTESRSTAEEGIVIGRDSRVNSVRGIAQGSNAHATADDATAIGTQSRALSERSQAFGTEAVAQSTNGIAVGHKAQTGQSQNQTQQLNAIAIGTESIARNNSSTALGTSSEATANYAMALGNNSRASAENSTAIGRTAEATGKNSLAFGDNSTASAINSSAIGTNSEATASSAIAFGNEAKSSGVNSTAIGQGATAAQSGNVALGAGSVTEDVHLGKYYINDDTSGFTVAGKTGQGTRTVSVGTKDNERQIQHVAPGVVSAASTDAINGSQLHATNQFANNLGKDTAKIFGGDTTLQSNGKLSDPNFAFKYDDGNKYQNVQDAMSGLQSLGMNFVGDKAGSSVHRDLGQTLNIKGGATGALTDNNISVAVNGADTLDIKLAENVNLTEDGSVLTGITNNTGDLVQGSLLNNDGLAVVDKGSSTNVGAGSITVVGGGNTIAINGSSGDITGLTNTTWDPVGTYEDGRAATEEQLKVVSDVAHNASQGWNVTTNADATTSKNVAPGATVDFDNTDGNIVIAQTGTNLTFDLADDLEIVNSITVGDTFITGDSITVGDDVTNQTVINEGSVTTNNLTVTGETRLGDNFVVNNDNTVTYNGAEIANLDDGLNFVGDDGTTVTRKLNETLGLTGGAAAADLAGEGNIGVVADGTGALSIQLSKDIDLTEDGSVLTGITNNTGDLVQGSLLNNDGLAVVDKGSSTNVGAGSITVVGGGNTIAINGSSGDITGLTNITWDPAGTYDDGRAATEEQLKLVSDVAQNANQGWNVTTNADATTSENVAPGATVDFDNTDGNIVIAQTGTNLTFDLADDLEIVNSITVGDTFITGDSITVGDDVTNQTVINEGSVTTNNLTVTGETRLGDNFVVNNDNTVTYNGAEIANLDDGLNFVGDDGTVVSRKLNQTLGLKGGASGDLTDANIGVVAEVDADGNPTGNMEIKLAQNIDLGADGSVTTGATVVDNDGLSITGASDNDPSTTVTAGKIELFANPTSTAANTIVIDADKGTVEGLSNRDLDADDFATVGRAATEEQLVAYGDDLTATGIRFDANTGGAQTAALGSIVAVKGAEANTEWDDFDAGENIMTQIVKDEDTGNNVIRVALAKDITGIETIILGENGAPGKDGADGAPGIGLDGKDGVIGITGKDGIAGADGIDGMPGASADITVKQGAPGIDGNDGVDGESKTRIVYVKPDGTVEEVATLNDGLYFQGDQAGDGGNVARKLNETLTLSGGESDVANLAVGANNVGIIKNEAGDGYDFLLAKDLTGLNTIQIGGDTGTPIILGGNTEGSLVLNPDGAPAKITNVAPGAINSDSTDAINGSQLQAMGDSLTQFFGEGMEFTDGSFNWDNYFTNIFGEGSDITNLAQALEPWNAGSGGGNSAPVLPGDNVDISPVAPGSGSGGAGGGTGVGGSGNIVVNLEHDGTDHNYTLDLADNIHVNQSITVGNTEGSYISMGYDGNAGSAGSLNFYGEPDADGNRVSASQTVVAGPGGVGTDQSANDGTRLQYTDGEGNAHTLATLGDGLSFGANDGAQHDAALNTRVDIVGAATNTDWSKFDAGQNIMTQVTTNEDGTGRVTVALSNDLKVESVTATTVNATTVQATTVNATTVNATTVNADSVAINNGGPVINNQGINMNDNRITNVAPGVDGSDAVNVDQLVNVGNHLQNQINDNRHQIRRDRNRANAGIAAAMATAGLPQAYLPGKSMVAVAGGVWRGESGVAIGVSTVSENGKWILKGSANTSGRGGAGGTIGAGYQW